MAAITDIAQAVVAEMNAHRFAQAFVAVRTCAAEYNLKEMSTLHVTVVPKGWNRQRVARSGSQTDYRIDVAVQKKVTSKANADVDPLITLADEIVAFFAGRRLTLYPDAAYESAENQTVTDQTHIRDLVVTTVVTLTFRVCQQRTDP